MMRDERNNIIYIGKAKSLKARLSSYFKSGSHDAKVTAMLASVVDFDYFLTKTENDALALEANLIKKHMPHYNILLKDGKSFPYIKIVDGEFPYLEVTRKTQSQIKSRDKYFGPYFNGIWARELLETIKDIFPIRSCNNIEFKRGVACINYQIERCMAPCNKLITKDDYVQIINNIKSFLRGEKEFGAREILTRKMETAAELEQFELAIKYRNGINFLDKLGERTIAQVARDLNVDVFAIITKGEIYVTSVLTVRAGKLIGIQNFFGDNKGVESEILSSFVMQYYQTNPIPEQIVAEIELDEVAQTLGCQVFNPKMAIKKKLLEMAQANANEYIETSIEKIKFKHEFTHGACGELGNVVGMQRIPHKIECFDVSHMGGEDMVASMVVFIDGVAQSKLYRRFKIKHGEGNNDYLSMQEVIKRRIARIGTNDPSFGTCPDLIIVDGGKGQLSVVVEIFENLKDIEGEQVHELDNREIQKIHDIQLIAIAESNEEIFVPHQKEPIVLSRRSYALRLVQRIRDEAHRFAITFHRKKRGTK
ncbi:MAG: excinuclease ABC subunit UvrC [Firmicutes bacterium]|nr:excinuclease ABC subunit UvrC [Bacillota bacterium]